MTQTTAISDIIQTLADVESRFNITRTDSCGPVRSISVNSPSIPVTIAVAVVGNRHLLKSQL